jgi:hypothetical protein
MMYEPEKSDSAIVAMKLANKAAVSKAAAELVEPRAGTKGNTGQSHTRRTQSRGSVPQRLSRVRKAASYALPSLPKVGAQCVNCARWDLCGGRSVMGVPTAIHKWGSLGGHRGDSP